MALITYTDAQTNLDAQGVPDAELLARAIVDLALDDTDIMTGGDIDAAKVRLLTAQLLRIPPDPGPRTPDPDSQPPDPEGTT